MLGLVKNEYRNFLFLLRSRDLQNIFNNATLISVFSYQRWCTTSSGFSKARLYIIYYHHILKRMLRNLNYDP